MQRIQLEQQYERDLEAWQREQTLDDVVDANDIAAVVAQWTGIPVSQMLQTEAEKLLRMEEALHERIVGQDEAVAAIADAFGALAAG